MTQRALPQIGDKIPAAQFFVSKMNARVNEAFGQAVEDELLTTHLTFRDIVQPFTARPEENGYGVIIGRRRFLAKMKAKAKEFEVGKDCIIREMTDEEALDASIRENLVMFKSDMNPITRAKALAQLIDLRLTGIRSLSRLWKIPSSTLTEWLTILELSPRMQDVVVKGLIYYTDALRLARLKLGEERQDELAEIAETQDLDAFRKAVERFAEKKGKRGIPGGKYVISRILFDRRYKPDIELYEELSKRAEEKGQELPEYCKDVLRDHVKRTA